VFLTLEQGHSELRVFAKDLDRTFVFYCSLPALLGAQRGTRTHLVSQDGECVLSKEADGVWIDVRGPNDEAAKFFVPADEYLIALTKLVEAKVIQKRISLQ
jgi:hypothetical protein